MYSCWPGIKKKFHLGTKMKDVILLGQLSLMREQKLQQVYKSCNKKFACTSTSTTILNSRFAAFNDTSNLCINLGHNETNVIYAYKAIQNTSCFGPLVLYFLTQQYILEND